MTTKTKFLQIRFTCNTYISLVGKSKIGKIILCIQSMIKMIVLVYSEIV